MSAQRRILLVSRDVRVLQVRKLMLGAYFDVYPAVRVEESRILLKTYPFHLMVLCYSLSEDDCNKIRSFATGRNAGLGILMVSAQGKCAATLEGARQVAVEDGPLALLKSSANLLGFEFQTKGRLTHALRPKSRNTGYMNRCA